MKIGFIAAGGFDRSGRERVTPVLLSLVEALSKRHDVHVFVLDYSPEPGSYHLRGATVHDLGRPLRVPGTRRFGMRRRLAAALTVRGPFDVLHAYQGMPAGWAATRASKLLGTPTVVTIDSGELVRHDDIDYGLQRRYVDRRAIGRTLTTAHALTVNTNFMRELAERHDAHPLVVPIGVDVAAFPPAQRADGPPWRLIRVASINRVKDYPTLLMAFAQLIHRLRDVHLDIVGEDTLNGAMQSMTSRLGMDRHVTFHGVLPIDQVARLYANAHLNVVSSRHEAACVSVLEAACTGLATVGTAVGYVADWAPHLAVAVRVRDATTLGDAMAELLTDARRRGDIATRARAWALEHDVNWTARRFDQIYQEVLTER
jgi:glycosyltransferase involved in cell wall biosynthesis